MNTNTSASAATIGRAITVACLLGGLLASDAGAAGRRYVSPAGYSFEVPPGYKRTPTPRGSRLDAVWDTGARRRLVTSHVAIGADIPEKALAQFARDIYSKTYGAKSKIIRVQSVSHGTDRAAVLGGETVSKGSAPTIRIAVGMVTIMHSKTMYILAISAPLAQRQSIANEMSRLLASMKIK